MLAYLPNYSENSQKAMKYQNVKPTLQLLTVFIGLPLLLSACGSDIVKLDQSSRSSIQSIQLVLIETPPLEIIPDLLYSRMPVYEHFDNMALPIEPETELFQLFRGMLIAGKVGIDDRVKTIHFSSQKEWENNPVNWIPHSILSEQSVATLKATGKIITNDPAYLTLPLTVEKRTGELSFWRQAIDHWYEQQTGLNHDSTREADAVVELGIGKYRVFAGQFSLQLLIKIIDPSSNQVIARYPVEHTSYEASIDQLFAEEGRKFKEILRNTTNTLLVQGFHEIGLLN